MNNESYLDPDIHLWGECDDNHCYHCGYKFPADWEPIEGTPLFEGFCCQECQDADKRGEKAPPCIMPMFKFLSDELGRDTPDGWSKSIYKGTNCGAWLSLRDCDEIMLGSIVEGSDIEIEPVALVWPFTSAQFWGALDDIEKECAFYWERDNSIWFTAEFTKTDTPAETYYGRNTWGEIVWGCDVPSYVKNKTARWFDNGGTFDGYDKPVQPCLGLKLTEYCNDMDYA